jgi:hypothetical protein
MPGPGGRTRLRTGKGRKRPAKRVLRTDRLRNGREQPCHFGAFLAGFSFPQVARMRTMDPRLTFLTIENGSVSTGNSTHKLMGATMTEEILEHD